MYAKASLLFISLFLAFLECSAQEPASTPATEPTICATEEAALASLQASAKAQGDALNDDGERLKRDAENPGEDGAVRIKVDVEFKDQVWKFDLPSVKMKRHDVTMHLPQTRMANRKMSFDAPECKLVNKVVGKKPEFKCKITWNFQKCETKWTDIVMGVPECRKKRHEIVMGIPQFSWDKTSFSLDIPEFYMERQEWKLKVPEFKLREIGVGDKNVVDKDVEDRSKALMERGNRLKAEIQQQTAQAVASVTSCHRGVLAAKRTQVAEMFEANLKALTALGVAVAAQGGDAASIRDENGNAISMQKQIADLEKKRDEALKSIDDALAQLDAEQKKAIDGTLSAI